MQKKLFITLLVLLNVLLCGCVIEGTITLDGEPLEGVTVVLSGDLVMETTTGSDGKYVFSYVDEGDYCVTASFEDYRFYPESKTITKRKETVTDIDFEAVVIDFDPIDEALDRSVTYLVQEQADEGYWMGLVRTDTSCTADYILLMHYLDKVDEVRQQKAINHILSQQQPDGGWYAYHGGPSELHISIVNYLALKLADVQADKQEMIMAKNFILANGGAESTNRMIMTKLALFGQVPWTKMMPINTNVLLFEDLLYKMGYIHSILIPYAIIYENYYRLEVPEERGIREIFIQDPWTGATEQAPLKGGLQDRAIEWILERQEDDGNWAGGVFGNTILCLLALKSTQNQQHEEIIDQGMEGVVSFQSETDNTIEQHPTQSPVMDTAYVMHALVSTGIAPPVDSGIERAVNYLLSKESLIEGDWIHTNPEGEPGGWGFEHYNLWFPDTDCTVMVLDTFASLDDQSLWMLEDPVRRGIDWVVSMQNNDGGWAAWNKDTIHPGDFLLQLINEPWIFCETSYVDITSRVILSLSNLGYPEQYGDPAVIPNAIEFIKREQKFCGYWYGRWGTNATYGTGQVLQGLIAAGEDPAQPYIRRAINWLKSVQNDDGGWGESPLSYEDPAYIGVGDSTAVQTAYVLIGLISAGEALSPEVRKGIDYLVTTMLPDGSWFDEEFFGTSIPGYSYLRYELASNYKSVYALSLFLSQM